MYETLKALSIRLDAPAQSLRKDAIAQLLIKIVYNNVNSMTKNQIIDEYKRIVKCDDAKRDEIVSILESLKNKELQYRAGNYSLSSSKRKTIDKIKDVSERRFQYVIENYCKPFFSDEEHIKNWLQDSLVIFFSKFSKEWISDLGYNQNSVVQTIEQVIEQISRKTNSNKLICKDDKSNLINSFRKIISDKDPELAALLWEYGTSQFSSQLIKNGSNIDKLTVDTFSDAVCILDTNILMHLALYGSDYTKLLNPLERIFSSLGITVKYLYITKEEYQNTICSKSTEILKLFDSFNPEVIYKTDNQLIESAVKLRCKNKEDFERFFKQIYELPTVIDKSVKVSLLDNCSELNNAIQNAQSDDNKKKELNSIYYSITCKDKREHALIHDVGLIAGINHLRQQGKYFILTQDSSIIGYAKNYPFTNGLPIAIKIDTLLNVLAVNSYTDACDSYVNLFAAIIRQGLQPNSHTFKIEDLFYILEKEQMVSQLPSDSVIEIVNDVSRKRLLGETDEDICKEITRKVQSEKFKVVRDLDKTREMLSVSESQKLIAQKESEQGKTELIKTWKKEKSKIIDIQIYKELAKCLSLLVVLGISLFFMFSKFIIFTQDNTFIQNVIVSIVTDLLLTSVYTIFKTFPKIKKIKNNREQEIDKYVNERLKETYG
ncbi:MAG: hypothetical protein ACI4HO_06335 [Ruminococcus sp.]